MEVRKKIVLGTYAFMLPLERRNAMKGATHEWTCVLRARNAAEDLSKLVRRVVFILHPSFLDNHRVFENTKHFHFNEYGWGEFEIICRITFHDPEEKQLELKHYLKLYNDNVVDISKIPPPAEDEFRLHCVVNETHDEICFCTPSQTTIDGVRASIRETLEPLPCSEFFCADVEAREQQYIRMCHFLLASVQNKNEAVKQAFIKRYCVLQNLMNIYHCCRPDRALQILGTYPQVFSLAAGNEDNAAKQQEIIDKFRGITKDIILKNRDKMLLSSESIKECIAVYDSLVQNGLLGAQFGSPLAMKQDANSAPAAAPPEKKVKLMPSEASPPLVKQEQPQT